ncbi:hypothetical protein CSW50_02575, partial [Thermus scotoductus]
MDLLLLQLLNGLVSGAFYALLALGLALILSLAARINPAVGGGESKAQGPERVTGTAPQAVPYLVAKEDHAM